MAKTKNNVLSCEQPEILLFLISLIEFFIQSLSHSLFPKITSLITTFVASFNKHNSWQFSLKNHIKFLEIRIQALLSNVKSKNCRLLEKLWETFAKTSKLISKIK